MINQGNAIVLSDNNKYIVVSTISYMLNDYVYLICENDYKNIKICKYKSNKLEEILDKNLLEKLVIEFNNKLTFEIK